jgi:N-ethylmaleimide reductase
MVAGGYTAQKAERLLETGLVDLVAFGRPFISNPDLPQRIFEGGPLAPLGDRTTLFGGGAAGYTDYSPLSEKVAS